MTISRPSQAADLTGLVTGELTVLSYAGSRDGNARWLCRCSCGTEKVIAACRLVAGKSRTCRMCSGSDTWLRGYIKTNITVTPSGCWEWQLSRNTQGYGKTTVRGRTTPTHILAYRLFRGANPAQLNVLHECDNKPCCNPDHLFLGTQADNMADMVAKERQARGVINHDAKLSDAVVAEIRQLHATGNHTYRQLSVKYGVTKANIGYIIRGVTWVHVKAAVE